MGAISMDAILMDAILIDAILMDDLFEVLLINYRATPHVYTSHVRSPPALIFDLGWIWFRRTELQEPEELGQHTSAQVHDNPSLTSLNKFPRSNSNPSRPQPPIR
jgi:hypothetical protein